MTSVESGDSRTRSWVGRKQRKPLSMNLTLKGSPASEQNEAEQMLESLGFSADHLHDRIPKRFLHPSKLKGIDFDYQNILDRHRETGLDAVRRASPLPTITGRHFFEYWISSREKLQPDSPEIFMK